ncbi:MAG: hypothetical protein ACLQAH_11565 [Limisphaerales bacterium]
MESPGSQVEREQLMVRAFPIQFPAVAGLSGETVREFHVETLPQDGARAIHGRIGHDWKTEVLKFNIAGAGVPFENVFSLHYHYGA